MNRPTGITILAWIGIVGGAIGALSSLVALPAIFVAFGLLAIGGALGVLSVIDAILGLIVGLIVSVMAIVFGVGALNLKPSAWRLGVLLAYIDAGWAVINIVLVLVSHPLAVIGALIGAIISIAITLVLLWYLFTDEVRGAFGVMSEQPISFLAPILQQIDGMFGGSRRRGMQPPQGTGGYPPPGAPGGYQQPPSAPSAPAHFEQPAPPQPPMPPSE